MIFSIFIKAVQEQPTLKHSTTSTETEIFHQLGYLRHNLSNTEFKRSTDRAISTERRQSRDLAVNTEPKIMYSKDVGDYDVRVGEVRREEISWNSLYGQARTFERGFQTDLFDTNRRVGYVNQEDDIEEQRQEIITFRVPLETRTEEIYETTITTETHENNRQIEEIYETNVTTEENLGNTEQQQHQQQRSNSPEELVEESYEIVSTLTKPYHGDVIITTNNSQSSVTEKPSKIPFTTTASLASASKIPMSEDENSYSEEWTVTEAKRKHDGETVQTTIDR